jgi:hypothetical protein
LLAAMAALATATYFYAENTAAARRHHDRHPIKVPAVNVPLVLRFGLGVYIIGLVYLVVRSWRRAGLPSSQSSTVAGRMSVPMMATLGLILLVLVIQTNPGSDQSPDPLPTPAVKPAVPPAELQALAYLPGDTDVVAAAHVAEAMHTELGKQAILSVELALALRGVGDISTWTGLKAAEVDHLVMGLNGTRGLSQGTIVVQTVKPYDPAAIGKAFSSSPVDRRGGRPVYSLPPAGGLKRLLWCAGNQTLVIVFGLLNQPDLNAVPLKARTGSGRLPAAIERLFADRPLGSGHPFWLAGRLPAAEFLKHWSVVLPMAGPDRAMPGQIESLLAGLRFDPAVVLNADLEARDVKAAEEVERLVRRQSIKGIRLTVQRKPADRWVSVQAQLEKGELEKAFGKP